MKGSEKKENFKGKEEVWNKRKGRELRGWGANKEGEVMGKREKRRGKTEKGEGRSEREK